MARSTHQGERREEIRSRARTHNGRTMLYRRLETATAMAAVIALVVGLVLASGQREQAQPEFVSIKIHSGETLWSVAEDHPIDGFSTAETARLIASANDIRGSLVQAESTLKVPATAGTSALADNRNAIADRQ